jgi:hypothetical protein
MGIAAHLLHRVTDEQGPRYLRRAAGGDDPNRFRTTRALDDALDAVTENSVALEARSVLLEDDHDPREIRLERACWSTLDRIGAEEGLDLCGLCREALRIYAGDPIETALWRLALARLRQRISPPDE